MATDIVSAHVESCQHPPVLQPSLFRLIPIIRDGNVASYVFFDGEDDIQQPESTAPLRQLIPNPNGGYFYGTEVAHA